MRKKIIDEKKIVLEKVYDDHRLVMKIKENIKLYFNSKFYTQI